MKDYNNFFQKGQERVYGKLNIKNQKAKKQN